MDAAQRAVIEYEAISRELYASAYAGDYERVPSLREQLEQAKENALKAIRNCNE